MIASGKWYARHTDEWFRCHAIVAHGPADAHGNTFALHLHASEHFVTGAPLRKQLRIGMTYAEAVATRKMLDDAIAGHERALLGRAEPAAATEAASPERAR